MKLGAKVVWFGELLVNGDWVPAKALYYEGDDIARLILLRRGRKIEPSYLVDWDSNISSPLKRIAREIGAGICRGGHLPLKEVHCEA